MPEPERVCRAGLAFATIVAGLRLRLLVIWNNVFHVASISLVYVSVSSNAATMCAALIVACVLEHGGENRFLLESTEGRLYRSTISTSSQIVSLNALHIRTMCVMGMMMPDDISKPKRQRSFIMRSVNHAGMIWASSLCVGMSNQFV